MLSHSRTDIRPEDIGKAATATASPGPAALAGTGRTAATRRIIGLTAELGAELSHFQGTDLGTADVHALMHGMNCTAGALTRILDQLRECPALAQAEDELGLPRHHTVRSELEQAAAAAEDLQVSAESLCRQLSTDPLGSP
ncbi:MAG TPA: hypothetical protein VHC18_15355 [Amycolatopsis sp.]|nr:hypothetical protein [Amycolatopsis sp.]